MKTAKYHQHMLDIDQLIVYSLYCLAKSEVAILAQSQGTYDYQ